ncbi:hypothetical protein OZX62_09055 [Bifidobacterium sp. ESL0690]|uniref:hypothetical protein n=1 Tax=Bifidobacterium sp. ESL0690 TaxID=2983214 RepID=UPI0023F7D81A|nr:hypothetical protein [Bifidobacterium sp. ESL0690]WEV46564.1 hypothetical protein OZX62_09055 [Bifidobacterium sp. ESL0690]
MAVDIEGGIVKDGWLARLALMPEVRDAAQAGVDLIALWPLDTAQKLSNDAKYAEDLQVLVCRAVAEVITGEGIPMADAEFVYEGAVSIPGRPQSMVDALIDVNDAYEQMEDYSRNGDTSLVMAGAGDLHVGWDEKTVKAVAVALEEIEQAAGVSAVSNEDGQDDGSAADDSTPHGPDVESVAQRLAVVLAAIDGLLGLVEQDVESSGDTDSADAAAARNATPIMLYINELCERMSIPRMYLTSQQFKDLVAKYSDAAGSGDDARALDAVAEFVSPLAKAEWEKHRNDVVYDPVAAQKAEKEKEDKIKKAKLAEKFKDIPEDKNKPPVEL